MKRALLIIAKRPRAGRTKTRLSPSLAADQAAKLYECLLRDTLDLVRAVPDKFTRFVLYGPAAEAGYFQQLAPDFVLLAQEGHDLGARLDNALVACLNQGFQQVVVMNSDGPTLPACYLSQAFEYLNQADVVFGPAEDGGYYLVGASQPQPRLLRGVKMSTPTVLQDTLALAREEKLTVKLLPKWYDIDTIADLKRLVGDVQNGVNGSARHTRSFLEKEFRV